MPIRRDARCRAQRGRRIDFRTAAWVEVGAHLRRHRRDFVVAELDSAEASQQGRPRQSSPPSRVVRSDQVVTRSSDTSVAMSSPNFGAIRTSARRTCWAEASLRARDQAASRGPADAHRDLATWSFSKSTPQRCRRAPHRCLERLATQASCSTNSAVPQRADGWPSARRLVLESLRETAEAERKAPLSARRLAIASEPNRSSRRASLARGRPCGSSARPSAR